MEDKPSKISKKEIMIRISCVLVAFFLWLYRYNMDNPERTTIIGGVRVNIINQEVLSDNNLLLSDSARYLTTNIRIKLRNLNANAEITPGQFTVEVDLRGKSLKAGRNNLEYSITKWPNDASLTNTKGNINIDLVEKLQVEKDITVFTTGKPAEGYIYLGCTFESTVDISGPKDSVNKIDKVGFSLDISNQQNIIDLSQSLKAYTADGRVYTGNDITITPDIIKTRAIISKIKTVPVVIKEKGTLPDNIEVDSKITDPSVIQIAGSSDLLDKTKEISTETIDLSKLDTNNDVRLVIPDGLYVIDSGKAVNTMSVKANYVLSKIETKNLRLPIKTINLNTSLSAQLSAEEVSVILQGKKSDLDPLNQDNVNAYLDLTNLNEGIHQVPVKLNKPSSVSTVSISPDKIEVTLTKN